jgi:hypothetical protein
MVLKQGLVFQQPVELFKFKLIFLRNLVDLSMGLLKLVNFCVQGLQLNGIRVRHIGRICHCLFQGLTLVL